MQSLYRSCLLFARYLLLSFSDSFDSSSASNSLWSLLQDVDSALVRLLNIGIYLAFKSLLQEALHEVLEKRLPYLMFSADEFSKNFGDPKFEMVSLVPSENLTRFVRLLSRSTLPRYVCPVDQRDELFMRLPDRDRLRSLLHHQSAQLE